MLRNYLKIAIRNLLKHKGVSFINIFGLATGMAVTMLIGLWVWHELSYNKNHEHYRQIAQVMKRFSFNGESGVGTSQPIPLSNELRSLYPGDFKYVVATSHPGTSTLSAGDKGDKMVTRAGMYMEPDGPELFSLRMLKGSRNGLKEPSTLFLSASLARALFGDAEPMDQIVRLNNQFNMKVAGVFEDLPETSRLSDISFIGPWSMYISAWKWVADSKDNWDNNSVQVYVQIPEKSDFKPITGKIGNILSRHVKPFPGATQSLFLHPMSRWHLYSEFRNGTGAGGRIQLVWLFGGIGFFVLLLACINFMNLSTARSEKRAKEVGIRKAVGSLRTQLIGQFYSESVLIACMAFGLAILFVQIALPWFNTIADKHMVFPWSNGWFWLAAIGFTIFTGLIAGSYPAMYLSSFQAVKVLKGTFRTGRLAAVPRKVLVVVQFTVSVILIAGTVIVFRQIQFAKDRPVGYNRQGLIYVQMTTPEIYERYETIRNALQATGAVQEIAESQSPVTDTYSFNGGFEWRGKRPDQGDGFATIGINFEYGKVVGWQFKEGRDLSRDMGTDSSALILNEAAARYMGLQNPIGETVRWRGIEFHIAGVIRDMIMTSPYESSVPSVFHPFQKERGNFVNIRINPQVATRTAIDKIAAVFKKYNPSAPFNFSFADTEYAKKFDAEERVGKLAFFFAGLAILISSLGLFGLASYLAEQRTKEIGIRKVLGASVFHLWQMLSKDFMLLVLLSCLIAVPVAWYGLGRWLTQFDYRIHIGWEIFVFVGMGALLIALMTVSYQTAKAALANPVKSLRSE